MPPFLPIVLLLAIVAAVFDAGVLASLVYLLVAIWLFVRWWLGRVPAVLTYRRIYESHLFFDEVARVTLELENRGAIPIPWLQFSERLPLRLGYTTPHGGVAYVAARATRRLSYTIRGSRRGLYTLGPLTLSYGDIFGFEDRIIRGGGVDRLIVYPRIVPLEQLLLPSRTPLGALRSRNPLSEDPLRIIGVRDYERGDSMRRIHWPATARAGRLQVKKLEPAITLQTVVLLDLHPARYDPQMVDHYQELAIVAAASFTSRLIEMRQAVGLISNGLDPLGESDPASGSDGPAEGMRSGGDEGRGNGRPSPPPPNVAPVLIPAARSRGHLIRILEALARIEGSDQLAFDHLLRQQTHGLGWGTTVVVVSGGQAESLAPSLSTLKRSGYTVILIVAGGRRWSAAAEGPAAVQGVPTYRIRDEADLPAVAEVLHG